MSQKKVHYQIMIHFTRRDKSKQAKPPNSGINRFYRCLMREFWGTIIGRHKKCCLNFCSVIQNVKNKHAWNFRHVVNKKFQSLKDGLDSYYKNSLFWNNLNTFCWNWLMGPFWHSDFVAEPCGSIKKET